LDGRHGVAIYCGLAGVGRERVRTLVRVRQAGRGRLERRRRQPRAARRARGGKPRVYPSLSASLDGRHGVAIYCGLAGAGGSPPASGFKK